MADWSRLVDMELTDDEKIDTLMPIAADRPDYPYGLRLCLTERELAKLGLDSDCEVGDMIDLRCFAYVTSISKNDGPDGSTCRVELEVRQMAAENELAEGMG